MKIRASKKYIQGIDMLVNNAQRFAEDVVNLPDDEINQGFVKFTVDMWRAVENYRDTMHCRSALGDMHLGVDTLCVFYLPAIGHNLDVADLDDTIL